MSQSIRQKSKSIQTALIDRRPILRAMLNPTAIALIGATEAPNSVGRTLMENLILSGRTVYPINLKRSSVLGIKAFPKIADVPASVELALIATPAITVPDVIEECASAGVTGAVIISAGFRESGSTGQELERAILARRGRMRLIGPNCLGVMIPSAGLNVSFAKKMARLGTSRSSAKVVRWGQQSWIGACVNR